MSGTEGDLHVDSLVRCPSILSTQKSTTQLSVHERCTTSPPCHPKGGESSARSQKRGPRKQKGSSRGKNKASSQTNSTLHSSSIPGQPAPPRNFAAGYRPTSSAGAGLPRRYRRGLCGPVPHLRQGCVGGHHLIRTRLFSRAEQTRGRDSKCTPPSDTTDAGGKTHGRSDPTRKGPLR